MSLISYPADQCALHHPRFRRVHAFSDSSLHRIAGSLVEAVLNIPEDALLSALEQALSAHLIRAVDDCGECYRFTHGLIQAVLYSQPIARPARPRDFQSGKASA